VAFVMSEWGCSRSTARRDVHWAHGELQLGLDAHDVQHLVTHLCTSLQRISLKAEGTSNTVHRLALCACCTTSC